MSKQPSYQVSGVEQYSVPSKKVWLIKLLPESIVWLQSLRPNTQVGRRQSK